jgi:hypothetical protein
MDSTIETIEPVLSNEQKELADFIRSDGRTLHYKVYLWMKENEGRSYTEVLSIFKGAMESLSGEMNNRIIFDIWTAATRLYLSE